MATLTGGTADQPVCHSKAHQRHHGISYQRLQAVHDHRHRSWPRTGFGSGSARRATRGCAANEVWDEIYDRLGELIETHRTTLIFVNTRRFCERVVWHLAERLGEAVITSHHGSLARAHRLEAERRLKAGHLRALVATASLELGIDIGDVDLVCQLGSPRSISPLLQRVGRSGHGID